MKTGREVKKVQSKDIEDTKAFAEFFVDFIEKEPESTGATIVSLCGDLGSGKTAFTKIFARILGVTDIVTSPTFILERIYKLPPGKKFRHLIHIDAYRLDSTKELQHLGFEDLVKDYSNLIIIEWPERVKELIPSTAYTITFTHTIPGEREITFCVPV